MRDMETLIADLILQIAVYESREGLVTTSEERDSEDYAHCQDAAKAILAAIAEGEPRGDR